MARATDSGDALGMSKPRVDGATRADLETVITCAMAAWDTLASADR
jgi:hypothetical protein